MSNVQKNINLLKALLSENITMVQDQVSATSYDCENFLEFADLHHLSAFLYYHVKGTLIEEYLTSKVIDHLEQRYSQQQYRNIDTLREAALIYDSFNAVNKDVLFLKGPFLARQFYDDMHQRTHMDIDILVRREDLTVSSRLIRDAGFNKRSLVFLGDGAMTRFIHAYEYCKRIAEDARPGYREHLPLDLHWALQCHFSFRLDYDAIWSQHEKCMQDGRPFSVLNTEYALVLGVLGIFIDIQLGTLRMKSFVDQYKMLEVLDSSIDWELFYQKRSQENISVITLNVMDLVLSVLDCRAKFPNVGLYIERNLHLVRLKDVNDKYRLLERSRFALHNLSWALTLYQTPVPLSFLWLLLGIPFRVAAHESRDLGFIKILRNRKRGG